MIRIHSFCIFYFLYFALRISYITHFLHNSYASVKRNLIAYLTLAKLFLKKIPVSTCLGEEQHVTGLPSSHYQPEFLLCHHRINWNLCTTLLAGMPPSPPQYKLAIYPPHHSANCKLTTTASFQDVENSDVRLPARSFFHPDSAGRHHRRTSYPLTPLTPRPTPFAQA